MKGIKNSIFDRSSGQAMVMMVIMMGGMMLSATAVAGLLMFYQLRQANESSASGMAVFAADAGLEAGSYCYFKEDFLSNQTPQLNIPYCRDSSSAFLNGASYQSSLTFTFNGDKVSGFVQNSYGFSGKTERALQNVFSNQL
ncbi:MAG: hypothetical protein ABSF47_01955 [Minisyncoccia bacterium]|jgi:hypothetical protein